MSNGEPVSGSPSVSGASSDKPRGQRSRRRAAKPRNLFESKGPDPTIPPEDVRLMVGRLIGTHGVRGDIKMRVLTDDPDNLLDIEAIYLGERDTPIRLEHIRFTNDGALIKLEGTDSPEDAALLSGLAVKIAGTDATPLEEGEFFLYQLIGLKAYLEDETFVGTVVDLIETGAYDVLVIAGRPGEPGEIMIPNHPDFVPEIDPAKGRLIVRPPEWDS